MSSRLPNYQIWDDMTILDMWRGVAHNILIDGFIGVGGISHVSEERAIEFMATEFYKTSEIYRTRGSSSLSSKSYKSLYTKLQSSRTYTYADKELWLNTTWNDIIEKVANVVSDLECPRTSWLPNVREMYHLHPNVVMGILWSIAHIPNENERNQITDSDEEYESDG